MYNTVCNSLTPSTKIRVIHCKWLLSVEEREGVNLALYLVAGCHMTWLGVPLIQM